ncbi:unnamed protein product, partial [Staurois parvus]
VWALPEPDSDYSPFPHQTFTSPQHVRVLHDPIQTTFPSPTLIIHHGMWGRYMTRFRLLSPPTPSLHPPRMWGRYYTTTLPSHTIITLRHGYSPLPHHHYTPPRLVWAPHDPIQTTLPSPTLII